LKNLGQFLVELGWISDQDLDHAKGRQQRLGGTLGTSLLEMGSLSEELLLKALSHQFGVEAAGVQDLRNIPPQVHGLLPSKLAVRCLTIPFRALGSDLYVAMIDIGNLSYQDEISFVTDRSVIPHVANEVRLFQAIEKYYGEKCPERFRRLLAQLDGNGERPVVAARREAPETQEPRSDAVVADVGTAPVVPQRLSASPPPPPPAGDESGASEGHGPPVVATPSPPPATPPSGPPRDVSPAPASGGTHLEASKVYDTQGMARAPSPIDYAELEDRLQSPKDRNEVGVNVLRHLDQVFDRVALFMVTRNEVKGWMGLRVNEERLKQFRAGFDQPSVFLNLRKGGLFFLGHLPPMPPHYELARSWGGGLPKECMLLPVRIGDRLVSVIYGDRGNESLDGLEVEKLQGIASLVARALERCILARKGLKG
jgi:hypothetical protein